MNQYFYPSLTTNTDLDALILCLPLCLSYGFLDFVNCKEPFMKITTWMWWIQWDLDNSTKTLLLVNWKKEDPLISADAEMSWNVIGCLHLEMYSVSLLKNLEGFWLFGKSWRENVYGNILYNWIIYWIKYSKKQLQYRWVGALKHFQHTSQYYQTSCAKTYSKEVVTMSVVQLGFRSAWSQVSLHTDTHKYCQMVLNSSLTSPTSTLTARVIDIRALQQQV